MEQKTEVKITAEDVRTAWILAYNNFRPNYASVMDTMAAHLNKLLEEKSHARTQPGASEAHLGSV